MRKKFLVLAGTFFLLSTVAMKPAEHLRLVSSVPAKDSVATVIPERVILTFNQVPDVAVSGVDLVGPNGEVEVGRAVSTDDDKTFAVPVSGAMVDGSYEVRWRTAGDDGHIVRRSFNFTLDAN